MKITLSSRRRHYAVRFTSLLILMALIGGIVACGGGGVTKYQLTMAVAGGNGTATDLTGGSPYTEGTVVTIQAVPAADYQFVRWTAAAGTFGNATSATTTFTVPAQNVTVTANFGRKVRNWRELDGIRDNLGGSYILMNDLDSGTVGYDELASMVANNGTGWQPIGLFDIIPALRFPFTGTFDGQGYKIKDLFINRSSEDGIGLFACVGNSGLIENVGVTSVNVTGQSVVGGLTGASDGNLSNCYVTGILIASHGGVGGLVGANRGIVVASYSNCSIPCDPEWHPYQAGSVGGLVGYCTGGSVIYSHSTSNVSGYCYIGGLIGDLGANSYVSDCYATGSVYVGLSNGGGLVRWSQQNCTVTDSYATGDVTGGGSLGGLVGSNGGPVSSCYATGNVTAGPGYGGVGGLLGGNYAPVVNSYSRGNVVGAHEVGGLVGYNDGAVANSYSTSRVIDVGNQPHSVGGLVGWSNVGTVENSFWDTEISGQNTSAGGTGLNTTQMQEIDTFSGATWDIIAVANPSTRNLSYIWNIVDHLTYAFLSWQP